MKNIPRSEYPRPIFSRENWMSLNGEWEFSFDHAEFDKRITVPFAYQTRLSGINMQEFHEVVWYRRNFTLPENMLGKKIILHFGAVDYHCVIWLNGQIVDRHSGGQLGFSVDITEFVRHESENTVCLKVTDDPRDLEIPRGKQYWKERPESIFYTPVTGIWQSVWLEAVNEYHIQRVFITPLYDEHSIQFEYELSDACEGELETIIDFRGINVSVTKISANSAKGKFSVLIQETALGAWNFTEDIAWSPENPRLFDVTFRLRSGARTEDEVTSYFGMRKISVHNGKIMLNNRPYYQKLILDQGYWEDSLLTAPDDDAFIKDIMLVKQMGFNGVRKHQKVEDPRFLFHADRLGLLVWGEIGSGYIYSRKYAAALMAEWNSVILRDYNHPCIVAWTPINESWGVADIACSEEQQAFVKAIYYYTKSQDKTRIVIDNDGWEHVCGDVLTIHDYESDQNVLDERYHTVKDLHNSMPAGRPLTVNGYDCSKKPVIISEFGGISFSKTPDSGWGYCLVDNEAAFLEKYRVIVLTILKQKEIQGFCYTQLADVEQETNGLVTYGRIPKVDLELIREINCGVNK